MAMDINSRLLRSVTMNDLITVRSLIMAGANPNTRDKWGETPIMRITDEDTVRLLIEKGATLNVRDKEGTPALYYLTTHTNNLNLIKIFLEAGANPNFTTFDGKMPLSNPYFEISTY